MKEKHIFKRVLLRLLRVFKMKIRSGVIIKTDLHIVTRVAIYFICHLFTWFFKVNNVVSCVEISFQYFSFRIFYKYVHTLQLHVWFYFHFSVFHFSCYIKCATPSTTTTKKPPPQPPTNKIKTTTTTAIATTISNNLHWQSPNIFWNPKQCSK